MRARCLRSASVVFFIFLSVMPSTAAELSRYAAPASDGESVGCYISTGDNHVLFRSPAVDSKAAIDGFFDILHEVYGVRRLYWRALQAEQMLRYGLLRNENFHYRAIMQWERDLSEQLNGGRYAVEAAHARNMEIWGVGALFDQGGQAVVDTSKGYGPWFVENKIRVEHPEWIPISRHGLRKISGPLCFEYPAARQALIDMFTDLALSAGYDGIIFHMYVEEFFLRYTDEFVYNPATIAAYRKRYGSDITREDFDPYAMANLRGEYLTKFFAELKAKLLPHHIKVGIFLDPRNPEYPQPWLVNRDIIVSGLIKVDWRHYIRKGLVDEVMVYCNGEVYRTLNDVVTEANGLPCGVSTLHSAAFPPAYNHFRRDGVIRTLAGGSAELEYGYVTPSVAATSEGSKFIKQLTDICQMENAVVAPDAAKLVAATRDNNMFVRRHAVGALKNFNKTNSAALAAAIHCLSDPENAVRCFAVDTICQTGGQQAIELMYGMLAKHGNIMARMAAVHGLANGKPERTNDIIRGLSHKSSVVRAVAAAACIHGKRRPEVLEALLICQRDPDAEVRWNVAAALGRFHEPRVFATLETLIKDKHPTVANMAALKLSEALRSHSRWLGPSQLRAYKLLCDRFTAYGEDSSEPGRNWAWRCFGEALERMGPRGEEALRIFLAQDENALLADHAWRILYVKLSAFKFLPITPDKAEAGYRMHPMIRKKKYSPPIVPVEPRLMPYIVQNFEGEGFRPLTHGNTGDSLHHDGLWRGFGSSVISPSIIESGITNHGKVLRLVRAPRDIRSYIEALRIDYRIRTGLCRVSLDMLLKESDAGLSVQFTSSNAHRSSLKVMIDAGGTVSYCTADNKMVKSKVRLMPKKWHTLIIEIDFDAACYSVQARTDKDEITTICIDEPLKPDEEYNVFLLFAGGKDGCTALVDNLNITVSNPAM